MKVGTCVHEHDPRIGSGYIVWHDDRDFRDVITNIVDSVRPSRFVETGTHMGWTSHWMAKTFPHLPIYTVEVDHAYYQKSRENLADFPQVALHHGQSPRFLRQLLPMMSADPRPSLIWLDAHWWPPVPLREECSIVSKLERFVCIIDDFEVKSPDFGGDMFEDGRCNLEYVAKSIGQNRCFRPSYTPKPGFKGYGIFVKGISYVPPMHLTREDRL